MTKKISKSVSLLDPESRGGHINTAGLNYQIDAAISYLPDWLAHDSFDSMVVEATGDIEARFFDAQREWSYLLIEAKSYVLSKNDFWKEIRRFQTIAEADVNVVRYFTLVCPAVNGILPILEALKRVKGPSTFYASSQIWQSSFDNFVTRVEKAGGSREDAEFLFWKVTVDFRQNQASNSGVVALRTAVNARLNWLDNHINSNQIDRMYADLRRLFTQTLCQIISRRCIESLIAQALGIETLQEISPPIRLHTLHQDTDDAPSDAVVLDWRNFFVAASNMRADQSGFDLTAIGSQLERVHRWITSARDHRKIQLEGHRRLSGSFVLGAIFPAVSKFVIETRVSAEEIWHTNEHAVGTVPEPIILANEVIGTNENAVIAVSCFNKLGMSADEVARKMNLSGSSTLILHVQNPITSGQDGNLVVHYLKQSIERWLQANPQVQHIHMTFRAPAFLILLLGHRLNLKYPITCYEWSGKVYSPICQIKS